MELVLSLIFVVVSIPAMVVVLIWACVAGYTRVHRKGYTPPATVSLLISSTLIGLIPTYFLIPRAILNDWPIELTFSIVFWLPIAIAIAVSALILLVLPRRNLRISGKRQPRFLLTALGISLIAVGIFFVVLTLYAGHNIGDAFTLLTILTGFGTSAILLGKRAASIKSVEEAISTDPRAPVLYLRPFRQEQLPFIAGKKSQLDQYMSRAKRVITSGDEDTDPSVGVRFEEYLQAALNARIGPFVALGNPEDYVPLEGAARTYARDAEWMQHVERLVAGCSCIVAEIGISRNLSWEMNYLRQNGFQRKLFIMTRPRLLKSGLLDKLIASAAKLKTITWQDFTSTMNSFGYEVGPDPGTGCVFTFDAEGQSVILKRGAFFPADYIEPIRDYLVYNSALTPATLDPPSAVVSDPPEDDDTHQDDKEDTNDETPVRRTFWSRLKRIAAPIAVVAALVLIFIGWEALKDYRERSRAEALQSLASQTTLRYKQGNLKFTSADLNNTMLIDHGNLKGNALYAAEGEYAGIHALLFDYEYEVEENDREGSSTRKVIQSVAAFCCADPKLPPFDLRDYSFWNTLGLTHREDAKHIEFAANPEFSKRFILMAGDEPSIDRIFSPQLRTYLISNYPQGNWHLEGVGQWLLLYQEQARVKPDEWKGFLDQTSQTAKGFLQNMGRESPSAQTAATSK
jgi:hypothetical protein